MSHAVSNVRPKPDALLVDIAEYAAGYAIKSREAYEDVLKTWKDADPGFTLLQQAKSEYARLK